MINYLLIFIITIMSSFSINAATISVEKGLFTRHARDKHRFNEDNELIGLEMTANGMILNASSFVNSYGAKTKSIGTAFAVAESERVKLDVMVGVLDGYTQEQIKTCKGDYCGYIAPRLTINKEYKGVGVKASALVLGEALVLTSGMYINF